MDEPQLLAALRALADADSELSRSIREDCRRSTSLNYETCVASRERQTIIAILREQPEFHGGHLHMWSETELCSLYESRLPNALIDLARRESPEAAIVLLRDVLSTEQAEFFRVVPVWGLVAEQPTWIADDVCVAPMHAVPHSPQLGYYGSKRGRTFMDHFFTVLPPRTALVATFKTTPFVIANGYVKPPPERQAAIARLDDARLCLGLAGPRTLVPSAHWEQFADPRLAAIMPAALAYSNIEIMPQEIADADAPLDLAAAAEILAAFTAHHDKPSIKLALDRFDNGMRRRNPGDVALEMAVALEAMLGETGSELGYKLALRAALLRGGTRDQRIETRSVIQALYALRSKVAHEGTVLEREKLPRIGKVKVADFMTKATRLVAEIIRAAILRRRLPDWFEEEVGGGPG